ncbi:MAG: hypothetical protein ACE5MH_08490 [Terriglobia bacterium]
MNRQTSHGSTTIKHRSAIAAFLGTLLAVATLFAQAGRPAEQTLRGGELDHIVLLIPGRPHARFVGPDLHLRELRYTIAEPEEKEPRIKGTITFGRKSALQKKLRDLLKKTREFEMVVYFLAEGKLRRLRFERVKVVRREKNFIAWTAARVATQRKSPNP